MSGEFLRAPFPWFGGKSRVAEIVWQRFGRVRNYVEPFFGSGAVLLGRPDWDAQIITETVNDIDGYISNFWRAIVADPDAVAHYADWPVNENDLHARHAWLVGQKTDFVARLEGNPEFFDAQVAGYWVWGMCAWIGGEFCSGKGPWASIDGKLCNISNLGQGINRRRPHLGNRGQGIDRRMPHVGTRGRGINRKLPHLGDRGQGIAEWFYALHCRLRDVRVCCGDWSRILGPSVTENIGLTAVFLDPPYSADRDTVYTHDCFEVANSVRDWCAQNGGNRMLRIALCGYDDDMRLDGWQRYAWKASDGYQSQNGHRERIWFSPHCLPAERAQCELFEVG